MFTYLDADESRPSLEAMMELYWRAMPEYQVGFLGTNTWSSSRSMAAQFWFFEEVDDVLYQIL